MNDTIEYFLVEEAKKVKHLEKEIKELRERIDKLEKERIVVVPYAPPYVPYQPPSRPWWYDYTWCDTATSDSATVTL
jgi:hypothetical protein